MTDLKLVRHGRPLKNMNETSQIINFYSVQKKVWYMRATDEAIEHMNFVKRTIAP